MQRRSLRRPVSSRMTGLPCVPSDPAMPHPHYDFRSDNVGGAAPEILEALVAANAGTASPYGDDDYTRRMNERFAVAFEHPLQVFPLSSGTGSNSIGLAALANPFGAIYCHETAHINTYECGAPEFFTGAKLVGLPGRDFKLDAAALDEALALAGRPHVALRRGRALAWRHQERRDQRRGGRGVRS